MTLLIALATPFTAISHALGSLSRTEKWLIFGSFWFGYMTMSAYNLHQELLKICPEC